MANELHTKQLTAIVIADTTDYAGNLGTRTDQIDLTSLASGSARQSAKVDLQPTSNLAIRYDVYVAIEFDIAPTSLDAVDFYIGFSASATAGTANPGGLSGSDSAYTGTSGDSLDDSLAQLDYIGSLSATADAATTVQFQQVGSFIPAERYGCFVVDNNADQALEGDAVEMAIRLVPVVIEVQ